MTVLFDWREYYLYKDEILANKVKLSQNELRILISRFYYCAFNLSFIYLTQVLNIDFPESIPGSQARTNKHKWVPFELGKLDFQNQTRANKLNSLRIKRNEADYETNKLFNIGDYSFAEKCCKDFISAYEKDIFGNSISN
jgi:hypothetical protein